MSKTMTNTKQPSLPPAPDGFAWMPIPLPEVDGACATRIRVPRLDLPGEFVYSHREIRPNPGRTWNKTAQAWRLMRRLGPNEDCQAHHFFLHARREWDTCGPHNPEQDPPGDWCAPARFPPGQAPDFGKAGWRYLDEDEPSTADTTHYGMLGRVTRITLPPLPTPEHASPTAQGEEGTEADAFDRSRAAYDEILADASDARRLRADVEALRAQLAHYRDRAQRAAIDSTDPAHWLEVLEEIAEGVW